MKNTEKRDGRLRQGMRLYFLFVIIGVFNLSCKSDKVKQVDQLQLDDHETIDKVVDSYVDKELFPFVYVRVEREDGSVLYEHTSTNKSLLPAQEINKDSWIRIWSMSKIVTICTVMDLVEEGVLHISDPVTKYIPEFSNLQVAVTTEGNEISSLESENIGDACPFTLEPMDSIMTISHLLNHKAGFYYAVTGYPCLDSLEAALRLPESASSKEFVDKVAKLPLIQQPGSRFYYGTNTTILGIVAERATGQSLQQLVEERITKPMNITGLQYGLENTENLTPRFSGADTTLRVAHEGELDIFGPAFLQYDVDHNLYLGGEGMVATADGYTDFLRMLANYGTLNGHRFLDKETIETISSPHTLMDEENGYNGYNLWVSGPSLKHKGYGDEGLWLGGGYEQTHYWVDPERKIVGIIMSQMFGAQKEGEERNDKIRGAIYAQLWQKENNDSVSKKK